MKLRIAQISDIHISTDNDLVQGVDVRGQFLAVLKEVSQHSIDALLISGDLCYQTGSIEVYQWIRQQLDAALRIPYFIIAGNHDESSMISTTFGYELKGKQNELYYLGKVSGCNIVFLDTARGIMSEHQKKWLETILQNAIDCQMVVMHHPPVEAKVPHMDSRYALKDREETMKILKSAKRPIHVFCGHYHVDKIISSDNVNVYICPSTFLQIDSKYDEFTIDHTFPGFRIIDISNQNIISEVRYIRSY